MKGTFLFLSLLWVGCSAYAEAPQGTAAPRAQVAGTVTSVAAQASQLVMKTDKGDSITVTTTDKTVILHMPAGVTDVQKGTKMTVGELAAGDRVLAYYKGAAGDKAVQATSLVVRTSADLGEIAKQELADWRKRGTVGTVTATDPAAKTITLKVGSKTVTVTASDKTEYHRYSLDSAKPADAKVSSFAEIKVGDQAHVLEKHGHTVTVAGNGYEAVSLLDREAFDLVLMDVQMPEMDGFEATAAIRVKENGTGRHI